MRKTLRSSPKVRRMARDLGIEPAHVRGLLFDFWTWADDAANEVGFLHDLALSDVDDEIGVEGFAEAMVGVEWLATVKGGLTVPEFDSYLGEKHRKRVSERKRKRDYRARKALEMSHGTVPDVPRDCPTLSHGTVPEMSTQTSPLNSDAPNPTGSTHLGARGGALDSPAPEPVKKPSSKGKPKAPAFDWREDLKATEFKALALHPGFEDAWAGWLEQRRALKIKPLTQASIKSTWRKWKADPEGCVAAIEFSTAQNYQGLIPDPERRSAAGAPNGHSRPPTGQEVVASLRRKMAAQSAAEDQGPRDVAFEPLFKVLPMPVKKEA